jgi:hypothetical protein
MLGMERPMSVKNMDVVTLDLRSYGPMGEVSMHGIIMGPLVTLRGGQQGADLEADR